MIPGFLSEVFPQLLPEFTFPKLSACSFWEFSESFKNPLIIPPEISTEVLFGTSAGISPQGFLQKLLHDLFQYFFQDLYQNSSRDFYSSISRCFLKRFLRNCFHTFSRIFYRIFMKDFWQRFSRNFSIVSEFLTKHLLLAPRVS